MEQVVQAAWAAQTGQAVQAVRSARAHLQEGPRVGKKTRGQSGWAVHKPPVPKQELNGPEGGPCLTVRPQRKYKPVELCSHGKGHLT